MSGRPTPVISEDLREVLLDYARNVQQDTLVSIEGGMTAFEIVEEGVSEPPEAAFAATDRIAELDAKVAAIAAIILDVRDKIPCLDPGVPWDALADISGALR